MKGKRGNNSSFYEKNTRGTVVMDYKYLFETNLHARLKQNIIGKIFVKVNKNDSLIISIKSSGGIKFETSITNFSDRILNGYSTEYAAYEVKKKYKEYITKRFFK